MVFIYVQIWNEDLHLLLDAPASEDEYLLPLIGVGMLFGSILLHEIGHAIAFTAAGFKVRTIALELWGGGTQKHKPECRNGDFRLKSTSGRPSPARA